MSNIVKETIEQRLTKWHQELDIFTHIKSSIILEGNIQDSYEFPYGDAKGAWLDLPEYLYYYFSDKGYDNIIKYNHIDGFSAFGSTDKQKADRLSCFSKAVNISQDGKLPDRIPARFTSQPGGAPYIIRDALTQSTAATVIILELASRYVTSLERMDRFDQESYTIIQQGILHAQPVYATSGYRNNLVVFIVNKKNDIPAWMFLNVNQIKSIYLDYPTAAERLQFIGGYTPECFFDKNIYQEDFGSYTNRENDLHRIIDRFIGKTEGFTCLELMQLRELCITRKIHLADMCSVVDLYTYGIKDNPWNSLDIKKLKDAKEDFQKRVKGQDLAIVKTLDVVKRAVTGMAGLQSSSHAKPKGVLFFAGPTGTGKTETAKTLAENLFGDESCCIRFDMSEYSQSHSDQKLLGAPPGYVGYEAGGQLTNAVKNNPFSILLFDEIEKAHPSILDKFLQILEDGRMTDGQGNTVYFSECIIIFTSNLGIYKINNLGTRELIVSPEMDYTDVEQKVRKAIEDYFKRELGRPEILNRIGENIVVFDFIRPDVAKQILDAQVSKIINNMVMEKGIELIISDEARSVLLFKVLDNLENGGRGIGNIVESFLINPLARYLFDEGIEDNTKIVINSIDAKNMPYSLNCSCAML